MVRERPLGENKEGDEGERKGKKGSLPPVLVAQSEQPTGKQLSAVWYWRVVETEVDGDVQDKKRWRVNREGGEGESVAFGKVPSRCGDWCG